MKLLTICLILSASLLTYSQENDDNIFTWSEGKYIQCQSDQTVPYSEGVTALIVDCTDYTNGLFASIANNPQLLELQIRHADQSLINALFKLKNTKLDVIMIEDFRSEMCVIPPCSIKTLTQLRLQSTVTTTLEIIPGAIENLGMLQIELNELTEWNGGITHMPGIHLMDITCLKLKTLPVVETPILGQYTLNTSAPFPTDICKMPELMFVYISTTGDCQLPPCYDEFLKREGLIEFVTFSEDEEKRTSVKSEATIRFEQEMEEENKRQLEEMGKE